MDTNSKKYKTILADPPWDINQRGNYGAIKHYDLMSLERISARTTHTYTSGAPMACSPRHWRSSRHGGSRSEALSTG